MTQFYWFGGHEQFQPEELVRHARLAEEAGFDGVMVSEHFHPWVDDVGAGGFAFATLGAIAVQTSRIQLMTAVTTPLFRYHPAIVAQAAATIDRLSNGRFSLGLGTGENLNEGPLGYAFSAYAERNSRMREALTILRALLDGERLDFAGEYYQTHAAKLYSPPLRRVPMYLAAGGTKSALLAAELADGVIASVKDVEQTRTDIIQPALAATSGRDFTIIANRWTVYGETDDGAWQALQAWRGLRAPHRLTVSDPAVLRQGADQLPRQEILGKFTIVRSPADYIQAYQPLVSGLKPAIVGIQTTAVDIEATIKLLGSEVLPQLRAIAQK